MRSSLPPPGLAILGGTFDPIHIGHLRPAEEVRQAFGLARVLLIPAGNPPHRHRPYADAADRLAMTRLAAAMHPPFAVLDWEVRKAGPSYAIETLSRLRRKYRDAPFYYIIGTDAFLRFDTWRRWEEILDLVHLIVTYRPGWAIPELPETLKQAVQARETKDPAVLAASPGGRIHFKTITALAVSATQVRELLSQGKSPRFLLPDPVLHYIETHGLYTAPNEPVAG